MGLYYRAAAQPELQRGWFYSSLSVENLPQVAQQYHKDQNIQAIRRYRSSRNWWGYFRNHDD